MAGRYVASSSRRLSDCCRVARVDLSDAHEALAAARAVAGLLCHLMSATTPPPPWSGLSSQCRSYAWPVCDLPIDVAFVERAGRTPRREEFWLDRIVATMPRHKDIRVDSYLEILESALLDRYLSAHEEEALIETAVELGLDRERLDGLHRDYLLAMARAAWDDGVITRAELDDLEVVARLLRLRADDAALALDAAKAATSEPVGSSFRLAQGDLVCLTGQMTYPREVVEALLAEHGLQVGGLTKKTRLLVAADPDSMSGKAKRARDFGVPVVAETALLGLLLNMGD